MRSIVIGTAGHIDHGKSALVRALTGTDPDRLKEEKERGITIDLGFASFEAGGIDIAFVDVPGHERFVKNMLAGAGGIDAVMLVVAADESVMPQTREHFQICRLLRVPSGIIVLTKSDLADAETLELATLEVRELVRGSFLDGATIVPASSRTGEGLDRVREALVALASVVRPRSAEGPIRLPIDRVFSMKGFGTVATGTLVSGCLAEDADVVVLPQGLTAKVRGVQVHGHRSTTVDAGQRVAVNLGGVEVSDLARGDTLCSPGALEPTRRVDVAIELLPGVPPLRHGARVRFHCGTTELLGRLALSEPEARTTVYARLHLESPAVVTRGDRFIIRSYSPLDTIGGGVVLDPHPGGAGVRTAAGRRRFAALDPDNSDRDAALVAFVEGRGEAGLERRALTSRAGLTAREADAAAARLVERGTTVAVEDLLVPAASVASLERALADGLKAHHAANPLAEGMPREEARERFFRRAPAAVFDYVVARLAAAGKIVARDRLALEGHRIALSPEEARVRDALERTFREARLAPPEAAAVASAAGAPAAVVERVLALMIRNRTLVRLESLIFHSAELEALKTDVRKLKQEGTATRVDVAAFKERYGISRKYAIPLLEYLDRERVTRRAGDARIVL
jgi:selenocysteine-specific elongation factor